MVYKRLTFALMGHRKTRSKFYDSLRIEAISSEGLGIARVNEKVVFVENCVPGDLVKAKTYQQQKNFEKARMVELLEPSLDRIPEFCSHFKVCGGCKWQYLPYEKQLALKEKIVEDAFSRLAKVEIGEKRAILAAPDTSFYRNKLEYTFSTNRWLSRDEISGEEDLNKNA
ncbi:MAG: TRAM domain-containing protein, partial [Bacteroidetes bacterium]|nr:TRAM domain-containing protein [Bacteroidota bacterium]